MIRYVYGYGANVATWEHIETIWQYQRLHPEFRRRLRAMFDAAAEIGIPLGIGGGARDEAQQAAQHAKYPTTFAPAGASYHEDRAYLDRDGSRWAVAADLVPAASWVWMNANCHRFGLVHFADVNREPWHVQPAELPTARRNYRPGEMFLAEPSQEDEMIEVIRNADDPDGGVYSTNGFIKTWLDNGHSAAKALARAGQAAPKQVDNEECASYGPIIGPIPAGHDAYGRKVG